MYVQVTLPDEIEAHAEAFSASFNAGQRGLRRFLHHIAKFAGKHDAATAFGQSCLDLEDFAADFRPGEPGRKAHFALGSHGVLTKLDWTKHVANSGSVDLVSKVVSHALGNK